MRIALFTIFWLFICAQLTAQTVSGKITNPKGEALEAAYVYDTLSLKGVSTNQKGLYKLEINAKENVVLAYSYLGYEVLYKNVVAQKGQNIQMDVTLQPAVNTTPEITIKSESERGTGTERIDSKVLENISTTDAGVEAVIKALPGVSSTNELSSQYTVRGGNFDENLVYVNDFEIVRPFLIRSGQQEGLSFINADLVGGILFSSGGFQAKYGDKMSSILDISYKKPTGFKGSIGLGLLGYNGHLEGISNNKKLTYLLGVRYKSNAYFLNALQTKGEYRPSFLDIQSYLTYDINDKLQLAWIGNVSRNQYESIPKEAEAEFGTVNQKINVMFYFDGQERDKFLSSMNGISLRYQPNNRFSAKLLTSAYVTDEKEAFDIISYYRIGDVETDPSKEGYGETINNLLGVGTFHDYARNQLNAIISNTELNLSYLLNNNHFIQAGLQYKYENIEDEIKEWVRVDSAGYSRPVSTEEVLISRYLKTGQQLKGNRVAAYIQDTYTAGENNRFKATAGLRFNYWSVNQEAYVNPRLQISFNPKGLYLFDKQIEKDLVLRASTGLHYQPPFYREMRNYEGEINTQLQSQKSWHTVIGADYQFKLGNKPFAFTAEAYYKQLWDLVPYDIDNVLIRYFGENMAEGYAAGVDFRVSGQFVGDSESWFSFSLLKTQEDIDGDYYYFTEKNEEQGDYIETDSIINIGYLNRPTDQRYNFNIFFQDHLPNNDNYKVHLNFVWGGGFAYGPPNNMRFRNLFRFPSYKRADIGFSALLFDTSKKQLPGRNPLRNFKSFWITGEVLNLLGFGNVISAIWVEDFSGNQYPAPNRSTSRLANVRLVAKF